MTTRVAIRGTGIGRRTKTEARARIRTERGRRAAEKTRLEIKECIKISAFSAKMNVQFSLIDYIRPAVVVSQISKKNLFHDY